MTEQHTNPKFAVRVGDQPPIVAVIHHDPEPGQPPHDSGFDILFSDAPQDEAELEHARLASVCLSCLIEHHPEIGRGLDLAKVHGAADRDPQTGEWTADETWKAAA